MDELLSLSHSTMEIVQQCPQRYFLLRIQQVRRAPSASLIVGIAVHAAIEADGIARLTDSSLALMELQQQFDTTFGAECVIADPDDLLAAQHDRMIRQGHATLEAYFSGVTPYYKPKSIEQPFSLSIEPQLNFTGRIDAITEPVEHGKIKRTIVEFKTASKPWSRGAEHSKPQATAYLMAQELEPAPARRVTFITLPMVADDHASADFRPTHRSTVEIERYRETVSETARQMRSMQASGDYPVRPGPLCGWCECLGACKPGQHWLRVAQRQPALPVLYE